MGYLLCIEHGSKSDKLPSDDRNGLQNQVVEVDLDDHVLDALHGDLEEVRVGSVGEVDVDFLLAVAVEVAELIGEELASSVEIIVRSLEIGEVVFNRTDFELLLEEVDFVEKEDDRGTLEPGSVDD